MNATKNCVVCGASVDNKKETHRPFICGTATRHILPLPPTLKQVSRIQRCFACGYCADTTVWRKLGQRKLATIREMVFSPEYQQRLHNASLEAYTNEDLCAASIFAELGDYEKAGALVQKTIWVIEYRNSIGRDLRPDESIINNLKKLADELFDKFETRCI